jgi:uncharacterized protein (DUF58 family)
VTAPAATRHRPTGRVLAAGLAVIGLANLAAVSGSSWFVLLAGATAGLLGGGLLTRSRLDGLQVELAHPARVTVGDQLSVRVTVTNAGDRPSSECRLCLHTRGLADVDLAVGRLDPGTSTSLTIERPATRRSVADSTTAHLVSRPDLGVVAAQREIHADDHVVVHPWLPLVPEVPPTSGAGDDADGRVVVGAGPEVIGPRQWRSGDDRGRLHWRSTARTGRPTMLERGLAETREVRLVLVGSDRRPDFEAAVALAASVCDAALAAGSAVTAVRAVAWHRDGPVLAAVGSRPDLLDWWSAVQDTVLPHPVPFGRGVLAGFGPGGLLVVGTADADREWLAVAAANAPGLLLRLPERPR